MLLLLLLPMLMLIIIGLTYPSTVSFKFITKYDSMFYYKVPDGLLLQSATALFIKCGNFIVKWNRFYKVQQNIPQAKICRIPEYGALQGANIWTYTFNGSWMWKTTTIKKTNKQTTKNKTEQNNRKKVKPICARAVTIVDSSFANLDPKTLLRMTGREGVRSLSTGWRKVMLRRCGLGL